MLIVVVHGARAHAETPSMSLPQALAHARRHQPSLAAARARLEAAQREARVPRAQWLPRVGATAQLIGSTTNNSTTTQLASPLVDVPRIGGTAMGDPSLQPYASTFVGVGVRQEIFDFGRIAAESSAAEALAQVEGARAASARLAVEYAVTQAFYAVLAARSVLEASQQAAQRAKVHSDFAEAAVASGVRPPIERTRAAADRTRFEVGVIRAEASLHIAQSVLAAAIGANEAEVGAMDERSAAAPVPDADTIERRVLDRSPEVAAARAQLDAQTRQSKAIGAQMRPNVLATAALSARAGGAPANAGANAALDGWVPEVPNYNIGLVLSWPIWEPTVNARRRAAEARSEAARFELDEAKLRSVRLAQQERTRVQSAHDALTALQRSRDAAIANAEQAETRFKAGLGTSIELADAEALRVDAEIQLAAGRFQWMSARASLARVMAEGT